MNPKPNPHAAAIRRCCETCKFGDFQRTPTGRAKRNETGLCKFPTEETFQMLIKGKLPTAIAQRPIPSPYTGGTRPTDGGDCPVWEAKKEMEEKR